MVHFSSDWGSRGCMATYATEVAGVYGNIKLYCIVLYCVVLYCIVLCCIVLYCIVLYAWEVPWSPMKPECVDYVDVVCSRRLLDVWWHLQLRSLDVSVICTETIRDVTLNYKIGQIMHYWDERKLTFSHLSKEIQYIV